MNANKTIINPGAPIEYRAHMLQYDIPAHQGIASPTGLLWRLRCIPWTESVWIVPDSQLALVLSKLPIDQWQAKGARVAVIRADALDGPTIIAEAEYSLRKKIEEVRGALDASVKEVRGKLAEVASGDDKGLSEAGRYARRHIRRAEKFATEARQCALAFDLLGNVGKLVDAIDADAAARGALYQGWIKDRKDNLKLGTTRDAAIAKDIDAMEAADAANGAIDAEINTELEAAGIAKPLPTVEMFPTVDTEINKAQQDTQPETPAAPKKFIDVFGR